MVTLGCTYRLSSKSPFQNGMIMGLETFEKMILNLHNFDMKRTLEMLFRISRSQITWIVNLGTTSTDPK